jgi:TRAP-type C4-dicarboxylate transport system permease small subunit
MNGLRGVAIALIIAGVLGLTYGGFTYTKETQKAEIGSLQLSVSEEQRVNVPIWLGIGALAFGGILLLVGRKN